MSRGWIWYPGTRWAPAWVDWRCSDRYYGWAPLPPAATFDVLAGGRYGSFSFHLGLPMGDDQATMTLEVPPGGFAPPPGLGGPGA